MIQRDGKIMFSRCHGNCVFAGSDSLQQMYWQEEKDLAKSAVIPRGDMGMGQVTCLASTPVICQSLLEIQWLGLKIRDNWDTLRLQVAIP